MKLGGCQKQCGKRRVLRLNYGIEFKEGKRHTIIITKGLNRAIMHHMWHFRPSERGNSCNAIFLICRAEVDVSHFERLLVTKFSRSAARNSLLLHNAHPYLAREAISENFITSQSLTSAYSRVARVKGLPTARRWVDQWTIYNRSGCSSIDCLYKQIKGNPRALAGKKTRDRTRIKFALIYNPPVKLHIRWEWGI